MHIRNLINNILSEKNENFSYPSDEKLITERFSKIENDKFSKFALNIPLVMGGKNWADVAVLG